MTRLLQQAFEEAAKLSVEEQDALAKVLLQDLQSELSWGEALEAGDTTTLGRLADEALAEHRNGTTKVLNPDEL